METHKRNDTKRTKFNLAMWCVSISIRYFSFLCLKVHHLRELTSNKIMTSTTKSFQFLSFAVYFFYFICVHSIQRNNLFFMVLFGIWDVNPVERSSPRRAQRFVCHRKALSTRSSSHSWVGSCRATFATCIVHKTSSPFLIKPSNGGSDFSHGARQSHRMQHATFSPVDLICVAMNKINNPLRRGYACGTTQRLDCLAGGGRWSCVCILCCGRPGATSPLSFSLYPSLCLSRLINVG